MKGGGGGEGVRASLDRGCERDLLRKDVRIKDYLRRLVHSSALLLL